MQLQHTQRRPRAVTLLELLVVLLIISILATIATGVYTGHTIRAKTAATQDLIRQLEVAVTAYEVDLGQLPPTGSGTTVPPTLTRTNGTGYLHLVLVHSMSGVASLPASPLWKGPYINIQNKFLDPTATNPASSDIIDAFGLPLYYVESTYYPVTTGTFLGGTETFPGTRPIGASTDLPGPNPYRSLGETYYNPSTYQIIGFGSDGRTFTNPYHGTAKDDNNNFAY